jgi:hypothetical protein
MLSALSKFHIFSKLIDRKEKDTKGESKAIPLQAITVPRE